MDEMPDPRTLRRGWTTGTCATAAAKAAFVGWVTGDFPDPVTVTLPGGQTPAFALARTEHHAEGASAGVIKDAGDDPDATHGAMLWVTVGPAPAGAGIRFRAGPGVGTVTKPGLPIPPGEPAINPVPREMIRLALAEARGEVGGPADATVTISIPGGEIIALSTLNGRLGIVGGLSVLGTTGIVIPFSCAAWIHSIHRGIDVARAAGLTHIAGATGTTSEAAVQRLLDLPETALIEMGDFVGGMLKYIRRHPVPTVTIAGGFAKMVKLGQGMIDLHSRAGPVDMAWLADRVREAGGEEAFAGWVPGANAANEVLVEAEKRGVKVADVVAEWAWRTAVGAVGGGAERVEVVVFDRGGGVVGRR
ncbi:cobalt-precorrin-5B (C(1))-methyltransferase [Mongoliimonas terrestris]|uniref:cobalt-precorrin-5B (C(1))-methyltransferase n=1 Tax=Mongoliimonas terrestris TaxID=1709001 RepID=UPI00094977FE|nr:cobalt-precorrin-5B (C(1))-methyltransferase [Mongoliimonas terrestris]